MATPVTLLQLLPEVYGMETTHEEWLASLGMQGAEEDLPSP
jgi:hypothetical protein